MAMTSTADLTSELVDLTTMSLREIRSAQSPALIDAVRRTIEAVTSASADDTQSQYNDR
ncbi:hypothetical protein [Saccharopolyspora shandongensis]|uniref:hypothetical protein n=1 Tax=Saccharopolyspora shandongensis TaxID=418495 RepID=UPI0033FF08DE